MSSAVNQFFGYLSECADWLYGISYEMNMTLFNHNNYMMNVIFIFCFYVFIILPFAAEVFLSLFFSFKTKRLVFFSPKYISTLRKSGNVSLYRGSDLKPKHTKPISSTAFISNKGGLYENIKGSAFGSRTVSPLSENFKTASLSPKASGSLNGFVTESIKGSALNTKVNGSIQESINGSVQESIKGSSLNTKVSGSVQESIKGLSLNTKISGSVQESIKGSSYNNIKGSSLTNKQSDVKNKRVSYSDNKFKKPMYRKLRYQGFSLFKLKVLGIRFKNIYNKYYKKGDN